MPGAKLLEAFGCFLQPKESDWAIPGLGLELALHGITAVQCEKLPLLPRSVSPDG